MPIKLVHDPDSKRGYGHWKCTLCGKTFYGGGSALHKPDCPDYVDRSYTNCEYHFTSQEVNESQERAGNYGDENITTSLGSVSVARLRESGYAYLL